MDAGNRAEGRELRFLRSVVENANDAILVTEAEPFDEPGPRIVYVNAAFTRETGYTWDDVVGQTPRILQGPDTDPAARAKIRTALERWKPVLVEIKNYRKDGTEFWVELNIVPVANEAGWFTHWVSVQRNVTERKREEERRRESEEKFRTAVAEQASDVVMIVEAGGVVRYASPSVKNVLGLRPEDVAGTRLLDSVHPDDAGEARGLLDGAISASTPGVGKPAGLRVGRGDGPWRHLEAVATGMLDDPSVRGIVVNAWDVTGRKRVESELRLRDRAIAASSNGIIITDPGRPDNPIVYVNPRFEQITGYSSAEAVGKNCRFLGGGDQDQPGLEELRIAIHEGREWSGPLRNYKRDGTPFWNELYIAPVRDEQGAIVNFIGVQKDVTDRRELEERLAYQAFHDGLTDLPNRNLFLERVEHALRRAGRREREDVAVLFMDLDNFKVVNDSLGHEVGDELLVAVARRLEACLRPADTAARLGGDEFVVLLEEVGDVEEATRAAERIADALRAPFRVRGRELFVTTSFGAALGADGGGRPSALLRNADLAMYQAKGAGKNRCAVYKVGMDGAAMERLGLETDLRRALELADQELRVYYQPEVDLSRGCEVVGFEALVRWEHPERGLLSPAEFIPLAEETGLILPLGRWVLERACTQAKDWQRRFPCDPPLGMSVNLSAVQFNLPDLTQTVAGVLADTGLDPKCLVLEITESMVVHDVDTAIRTLDELRALGVRVAVDDFGTGHSSLSYLKRFPVDCLKIDRSFVAGLGRDAKDEGLVSATIGIAHALGLSATAEGVETREQLERLRALGCESAQGFHFWKPMPPDAASMVLASASGQTTWKSTAPACST